MAELPRLRLLGMDVVLAYTVRGTKIYEQPSSVANGGQIGFVRTFKTDKVRNDLLMRVCEAEGATGTARNNITHMTAPDGKLTVVGAVALPKGAGLEVMGGRVALRLPKSAPAGTFKLVIWNGSVANLAKFPGLLEEASPNAFHGPRARSRKEYRHHRASALDGSDDARPNTLETRQRVQSPSAED